MSENTTNLQLIESVNFAPDCVSLSLETLRNENQEIDLYLSLNFSEQWLDLLEGKIKLALKGGELKLNLINCHFTKNYPLTNDNLYINTSPDYLSYYFTVKDKSILNTTLNKVKIATLNINNQSSAIEASFNLSLANISLVDAEGLWKHDITPNKHGILDRTIAKFLLEKRFIPHISYCKIASETINNQPATKLQNTNNNLPEIVDKICNATTDNLLELADLAFLNPSQDFAGANFLATNLTGLDLSSCNLEYINLRGAVITDTDLSDSNLSHAKLSGADLSGAYLENANLSYADFHAASLALVNLIGANLTGAILTETNLTNANFSSAILTDAIFSKNTGISDSLKTTLLAKGAYIN